MSLKFSAGDRFEVQSSYDPNFKQRGTVKSISFNSIHQDWEYVVEWDHTPGEHGYECIEAERLWEKSFDAKPINSAYTFHTVENTSDECTHQWAQYVGFTDFYEYCKKCDIKRSNI